MSEIQRVLGEFGVTVGQDAHLGIADRGLVMEALRMYGEHLLATAVTVRTVKPTGADRKAVAAHLDTVSARANLLANLIDVSKSVTVFGCGDY